MTPTPPETSGVSDSSRQDEDWKQETASAQYVIAGDPGEEQRLSAGAHPSPGAPVSPHPSYYSASDLPPPSPMPEPQYIYYSPGPTATSTVVTPASARTPPSRNNLEVPYQAPTRNEFPAREDIEMRTRSPPSAFPASMQAGSSSFPRAASRASETSGYPRVASRASEHSRYATASEGWNEDEDDMSTINDHERPGSIYSMSPRAL